MDKGYGCRKALSSNQVLVSCSHFINGGYKETEISWHKFMSTTLGVLHGFNRGGLMAAMFGLPRIWLSHVIMLSH